MHILNAINDNKNIYSLFIRHDLYIYKLDKLKYLDLLWNTFERNNSITDFCIHWIIHCTLYTLHPHTRQLTFFFFFLSKYYDNSNIVKKHCIIWCRTVKFLVSALRKIDCFELSIVLHYIGLPYLNCHPFSFVRCLIWTSIDLI